MASAIFLRNSILIRYISEVNTEGNQVYKTMKFSGVRPDITDDEFYAVGTAIMTLVGSRADMLMKSEDYLMMEG